MTRLILSLIVVLMPSLTLATDYSCNFNTECYEDEACATSNFAVEVRGDEEKIATDFGTFPILAIRDEEDRLTVFVTSDGAVYLLSASGSEARFTAHITDGPQAINYLGTCEKVG
ncbi:hypothetical protein [Pseudooceanicola sp. MF1-13]|uniref:hypothetical protein n=1 Tax=Pseudooceanicola sp. MF1-13 TaxID=3379095 RepID=UPI0038927478